MPMSSSEPLNSEFEIEYIGFPKRKAWVDKPIAALVVSVFINWPSIYVFNMPLSATQTKLCHEFNKDVDGTLE